MHAFKLMNQANNATIKETVQLKLLESMAMYIGEKPILLPCSSTTALCRSRTGHSPHLQSFVCWMWLLAFLSVQVSIITSTIQCNQNSRVMDHVQMGGGHTNQGKILCQGSNVISRIWIPPIWSFPTFQPRLCDDQRWCARKWISSNITPTIYNLPVKLAKK